MTSALVGIILGLVTIAFDAAWAGYCHRRGGDADEQRRRYGGAVPVSLLLWTLSGLVGSLLAPPPVRFIAGPATALVTGVIDVTLGWWISMKLGPGMPPAEWTRAQIVGQALRALMFAGACGAIGSLLVALLVAAGWVR